MQQIIKEVEKEYQRAQLPDFRPGDTVKLVYKIKEGDKERLQEFQGTCIRRRGKGTRETLTLRRISYGIGVERTFPLHSPLIESLEVVRRGRVRRARLYYLRGKKGKAARIQELRYDYKKKGAGEGESPANDEPVDAQRTPEENPEQT